MKPFLIFVILLMLGAMFIIGENPQYNPFHDDENMTSTGHPVQDAIANEDKHMGEN